MALTKGVNSYATVAEADTYFTDRLDVAAWIAADALSKEQSLITATSLLDDTAWTGVAISQTQPLAFPRSGGYFDPKLGIAVTMTTAVPQRVVTGVIELAYHLLNNDGLLDDTGRVDSLNVGSIQLTKLTNPNRIPFIVKRLIKPLLCNGGANTWWRAN
jgi:hypothetical protein